MTITFHYCNCGLTDDYFSETIMIYAPCRKATLFVNVDNLPNHEQSSVDDLLTYIKNHLSEFDTPLGDLEFKDVNAESVYLYYDDFLLKIGEKSVCEVFSDFKCEEIELYYFSVGGASIEYKNGYRFIIHSDEKSISKVNHTSTLKKTMIPRVIHLLRLRGFHKTSLKAAITSAITS